ncbi:uncharacterized protein LOC133334827 [Musca vetustissima]|uniref:uncharacterized protein LOC133334827 n=1 Tax=Musca vetustissima TaxID=27455 RepID=UPI002AB7B458|nr:uncharacterized protein LOC133334827 [Musca vetustissima]
MSTKTLCTSEVSEEAAEEKSSNSMINGLLDNSGEIINTSYRLQSSYCSTVSNDSELSSLSLCLDREMESYANPIDIDELPAFEVRLISPLGRTPSPIDSEDMATPTRPPPKERLTASPCLNNPDYVALQDINAQISPPSDNSEHPQDETCLSRTSSLETIYEGVFLNTPPRSNGNSHYPRNARCRTSLLEKVALNRLQAGKENKSPLSKSESPLRSRNSLDFSPNRQAEHGFS